MKTCLWSGQMVIKTEENGAILAVDYGLKRVGLAVCDPECKVAVGAGAIENLQGRKLARAVQAEAVKRNIRRILIGEPGQTGRDVDLVHTGSKKLADYLLRTGFEVIRWDESYTTASALSTRKHFGGKSRSDRTWIDEASAIILLQDYLNSAGTPKKDEK